MIRLGAVVFPVQAPTPVWGDEHDAFRAFRAYGCRGESTLEKHAGAVGHWMKEYLVGVVGRRVLR